jgi:hypothetical protein
MSQPEDVLSRQSTGLRQRLAGDHERLDQLFEALRAACDANAA